MEHIKIEQNSNVEVVDSNIIHKLAEEAQDCDASSNMTGNLQTTKAYEGDVNFLTGKFPGLQINATQGLYISFEDKEVERVLAAEFGDGNGLTTTDILLITTLNGYNNAATLKGNTDIVSFDEFARFANCTQILNGAFQGCSNLERITLPSTLTVISNGVFYNCVKLQSINLDNVEEITGNSFVDCTSLAIDCATMKKLTRVEGFRASLIYGELDMPLLTTMSIYCFQGCGGITKVKCLGKLSAIPQGAFTKYPAQQMALTEVYLPYECTEIGADAFNGCANLTTIKQYNKSIDQYAEGESPVFTDIGARITSINNNAFNGTSISGEYTFPNITTFGAGAFNGSKVTKLDFTGSTFTTFGDYFMVGSSYIQKVVLPDTIASIGNNCLRGCSNLEYLKVLATTPPSVDSGLLSDIANPQFGIYVPDNSVTSYQTASGWSDWSSRIFPLSQFSTDFPND